MQRPLADRQRPKDITEYIGQSHLVGKNGKLKPLLDSGLLPSLILWGPPGTGKTTLARLLAQHSDRKMYMLNAVNAGVKDVRDVIDRAKQDSGLFSPRGPVLFIDEIHRFNKAQQDALLNAVETGLITLIGATTENPSFEVISALLSRCQVYILNNLSQDELRMIISNAVERDDRLISMNTTVKEDQALIQLSGGDARRLLNLLELAAQADPVITNSSVEKVASQTLGKYDKGGDIHYDTISAFIKSIRGSDPNAAVYYLARMLDGGEDIKFIARRMIILASEDIGNANPTALVIANSTFQSVNVIGMPEARIVLSQCAIYLASSPKSNSSYVAISKAMKSVRDHGHLTIPVALRNAPTKLMKENDFGKNYQYSHDGRHNFIKQEFLPKELSGSMFYQPGNNKREQSLADHLKKLWGEKYGF
jgi:putative ATPase